MLPRPIRSALSPKADASPRPPGSAGSELSAPGSPDDKDPAAGDEPEAPPTAADLVGQMANMNAVVSPTPTYGADSMARNHGLRKDCAEANVRLSQRALQATAASFMERRFTRKRQHEARVKSNRVVDCATKLSPLVAKALQALDEPEPIDKSTLNTQWDAEQVLKMLK